MHIARGFKAGACRQRKGVAKVDPTGSSDFAQTVSAYVPVQCLLGGVSSWLHSELCRGSPCSHFSRSFEFQCGSISWFQCLYSPPSVAGLPYLVTGQQQLQVTQAIFAKEQHNCGVRGREAQQDEGRLLTIRNRMPRLVGHCLATDPMTWQHCSAVLKLRQHTMSRTRKAENKTVQKKSEKPSLLRNMADRIHVT